MTDGLVLVGTDSKAKQEREWLLNAHLQEVVTVVILDGCKAVIPVLRMVKVIERFAFARLADANVPIPLPSELGTVLHFMFITSMVPLLIRATVVVTINSMNGNRSDPSLGFHYIIPDENISTIERKWEPSDC